ncbi:ABC transporter ATP-binding protein [Roseibium sp. CAU 1637]|uniref:ABC transporter ATP-binding protein n=1 Tax=Roseibium limicola TaxID=2816037 RepID=A0A939J811_9HYPH|nr:ABC transporter ATP-binding protein [Roseibium limicola]
MIEVRNLTVERGGKPILSGYEFSLEAGGILAVLGANGVGKTTLINTLIGVLKPRQGTVQVKGKVGFVPQLFEVPFAYSCLDIALMGRARHLGLFGSPGKKDFEIVRHYFRMLGIESLETHAFNALSGGQRQLVMIAQALVSECELLVLDEPCAALDYKNQDKVLKLLHQLQTEHGLTIIFSTHMPQHAVEIATDVLLMTSGTHFMRGKTVDVLTSENLSTLYDLPIARANFDGLPKHTFAPVFRQQEVRNDGRSD